MSAAAPAVAVRAPSRAEARDDTGAGSLAVRLAVFTALSAFGAAHWYSLVARPPDGAAVATVVIVTAGAVLLAGTARLAARPWAREAAAAAVALTMTAAALVATGLSLRLLLPGGWGDLDEGVRHGLESLRTVTWPYAGDDEWLRLVILLGAPLLLAAAATLAFWPGAGAKRRGAALVALLVLYGVAVTQHDPGEPLARGLALLVLVGAWLWLPRMSPREAAPAAALVLAVGVVALPLAARLDAQEPWVDWRAWNPFGGARTVSFDWNHSYGPLDWPRDGTTLLSVRSRRPHYWKTEVLDNFDGLRWVRSGIDDSSEPGVDLPREFNEPRRPWRVGLLNRRWVVSFDVSVRALRSDLMVVAGTPIRIVGAGPTSTSADGTTRRFGDPLERGDGYRVQTYEPDPSAAQMRAALADVSATSPRYTSMFLPDGGETAVDNPGEVGGVGRIPLTVAPRAGPADAGDPDAGARLRASPYDRVHALARRLTAASPTQYDAVKAVEDHLQRNYRYDERVPTRPYPLAGFLFQDRRGYCQQFSGAMALMLRTVGIPARVVGGFSPGSYDRGRRRYRVRDLDAHSWVEVYFGGIGWVPFDPTPSASPAESQAGGLGSTSAARADAGEIRGSTAPSPAAAESGAGAGGGEGDDSTPWWAVALAIAAVALGGYGSFRVVRSARARTGGDARLRELERALARLGFELRPGTTLLALERRLARAAGPASAAYAAGLRRLRFAPGAPSPPGERERRAARRELAAAAGGPLARLRALRALPPAPPILHRRSRAL